MWCLRDINFIFFFHYCTSKWLIAVTRRKQPTRVKGKQKDVGCRLLKFYFLGSVLGSLLYWSVPGEYCLCFSSQRLHQLIHRAGEIPSLVLLVPGGRPRLGEGGAALAGPLCQGLLWALTMPASLRSPVLPSPGVSMAIVFCSSLMCLLETHKA